MGVLGRLALFALVTAVQMALLFGLAMAVYAIAGPLVRMLDIGWRDDLRIGLALFTPMLIALALEPVMEGSRLDWLRLSQNPLFLLPP